MCFRHRIEIYLCPQKQHKASLRCLSHPLALMLIFIFFPLMSQLFAQAKSEEYLAVKNWKLPQEAVASSELVQDGEVMMYREEPFNGIAFSSYPDGRLMRVVSYLKGRQDGLMLLWYPDGAPQMSATYKQGVLHGRFLGWYQNGGMIYDMVINRGTYAGDSLAEGDDSRSASEGEDIEREGPDNDQSRE